MPRKSHTEEEIIYALRQAEAGEKVSEICRETGVSQRCDSCQPPPDSNHRSHAPGELARSEQGKVLQQDSDDFVNHSKTTANCRRREKDY